jgi:hypothetical protein
MKIWFDYCSMEHFHDDFYNIKLGIGWYRHAKTHKWWGFTVEFYFFKWVVFVNYVSNWNEYDKKVNYRKYKK